MRFVGNSKRLISMPSRLQDSYKAILDGIPSPVFIVEADVAIVDYNATAARMLARNPDLILRKRAGEVLHCLHSEDVPGGCGRGPVCPDCIIRNSVDNALKGRKAVRVLVKMESRDKEGTSKSLFLFSASPLEFEGKPMAIVVLEDIGEITSLRGLLPICCNCKQVRTDTDYWQSVEEYFKKHLDIDFSHGMCPACAVELFPDDHQAYHGDVAPTGSGPSGPSGGEKVSERSP